ncbi:MAG TPA: Ig-like domain-containing protein [Lacunisphaera sp.]|nr:Ig-like domain-containing protein [Lacunisphaera sp.]
MPLTFPRFAGLILGAVFSATVCWGSPSVNVVYNPATNSVQGPQPLSTSYVITVTAPSTLSVGVPVTVDLNVSLLGKPNTGVSDADALSFVSLSPSSLTFNGPNEKKSFTVYVDVPAGNYAGDYEYHILPSGWPAVVTSANDAGAFVNAKAIATATNNPPAITLQSPADGAVYTYQPATGNPVTVPVSFSASVLATDATIQTMQASIASGVNVIPISLTGDALPAQSASASGSVALTVPGNYTVTVAAGNTSGTSYASANITVNVDAPPPTITVASPTANASFSYTLGGLGASVPVSFTATSIYGNITSLTATLDGQPVALNTNGVGTATTANASATLTVPLAGNHTLVLNSGNAFGAATPVTIPFSVAGVVPAPTVSILSPANGSTFVRNAGDPATVINYAFSGGTTYGSIAAVSVTLDGAPVSPAPTLDGLGTAALTGNGTLSFSAAGSHTLTVSVTSSGATIASATTSFNVTQVQAEICEDLTWLPPLSNNQTVEGGSTVPIKFTLECQNKFVRDTGVLIAIYEVFRNGSTSTPTIYRYGTGSPNPPDYAITGKQYHLNFTTAKGTHSYQIEVYTPVAGSMRLLGTHELNTKGSGGKGDDHGEHGDDHGGSGGGDDHDHGDCDNDRGHH